MKLIFVVIVCAAVFLICFLIDTLLKLIFPKSKLEKSKQVVRPPRRSAVIGVILTFAGVAMLVKNPEIGSMQQTLLEKHFNRKHGPGAYYGQSK